MQILGTLIQYLSGMASAKDSIAVRGAVAPLTDRFSSCSLNSAGLAIKSGGSALAKIGATDYYAVVNGTLVKVAASTDMPALTGINMTAAYFNVVCFFVDQAGNLTALGGNEGASLGAVRFPPFPQQKALIGFLLITYASAFVGGTTPLDTATTVYVNASTAGVFDPSALLGF
jgi:hypothetical protein